MKFDQLIPGFKKFFIEEYEMIFAKRSDDGGEAAPPQSLKEVLVSRAKDKTYLFNVVLLPSVFFLISLSIIAYGPEGPLFFRYEKAAVMNGEWWRIISCHFTHTTWNHFFLNMLGLFIMSSMFSQVTTFGRWLGLMFFSGLFCSACFLIFTPGYNSYVGMSAVLHGVIIAYALVDFKYFRLGNVILITGTLVKVIWEQSPYYVDASSEFIGGTVATESHLYGAISGIIIGAVFVYLEQKKSKSELAEG